MLIHIVKSSPVAGVSFYYSVNVFILCIYIFSAFAFLGAMKAFPPVKTPVPAVSISCCFGNLSGEARIQNCFTLAVSSFTPWSL